MSLPCAPLGTEEFALLSMECGLLGLLRQRSLFKGSLYTESKLWLCEVMIRRVLTSAFSCRPHTVSWPGIPTLGGCFEAASLHCKQMRFFSYQGSPKVPQETLRFEICLESKSDIITIEICVCHQHWGRWRDLIYVSKVACLGSCAFCVIFFFACALILHCLAGR